MFVHLHMRQMYNKTFNCTLLFDESEQISLSIIVNLNLPFSSFQVPLPPVGKGISELPTIILGLENFNPLK